MKGIFAVIAGFALIHEGGVQLAGGRDADRHQREQPDRFCRRADGADPNERESSKTATRQSDAMLVPQFRVDPFWPKPLPNHWLVGAVAGVAVDSRDHVWITHRPSSLQPNETRSMWRAAPP